MNPGNSQEALGQLQQIQSQSQDPNTILAGQRQQLGVNGAQETVTGLRGAINNTTKLLKQVAPSVMGRTGSSLVTNAQATKQISNEQAPISQNLSDQSTEYGQANQDLSELQSRAQEAASGIYKGQQDKLSYAQNLYNTLYQKERDAEASRQQELQRQEQVRQFNEQMSADRAKTAAAGRVITPNISADSTPKGASAQQRNGGGYNFTDPGGQSISAAAYASASGKPIGEVLYSMGQSGDKYAQQAYNQIQANQAYYNSHPDVLKKEFAPLFWGT